MKKIYSIIALSLSLVLLSKLSTAQLTECAGTVAVADFRNIPLGNGQTACAISVTTSQEFVGATVRIYSGPANALVNVTPPSVPLIAQSFDSNGNPVGGLGGVVYTCGTIVSYVSLTTANGTCYKIVAQNASLPINLSAFTVRLKGASANLSWTSAQEFNSSAYEIEKSSDAKNFTKIGSVKAAGLSLQPLSYSFDDNNFSGAAYYRLKMIDIDGTFEYSKVVYVNGGSGANGTLSVFPNPFRSDVQLKGINASDVNKAKIRIFSAAGKEVSFKVTGANSISIDPSVPQGIYMLRVEGQTYKLVKERN